MNEMLIVEGFFGFFFFFLLGGSDRSTPARLHQHIVSAFVFALAAETLWQGSRGLGIYKQEESGFGNRAENRSASSPKQLLFLPVDPGGPRIFNTSPPLETSHPRTGTMAFQNCWFSLDCVWQ